MLEYVSSAAVRLGDGGDAGLFAADGAGSGIVCGCADSLAFPAKACAAPATIGVGGALVPALDDAPDCALGISPVITAMPIPQNSVIATPATIRIGCVRLTLAGLAVRAISRGASSILGMFNSDI